MRMRGHCFMQGQLHREVVERLCGSLEGVDRRAEWPKLNDEWPGPNVVIRDDSKRFGKSYPIMGFCCLFHGSFISLH
jgi:hypothetical protein